MYEKNSDLRRRNGISICFLLRYFQIIFSPCGGVRQVCQIYATEDGNTGHPTQESLDSIMAVSNNFTTPVSGLITLRDVGF